MPSRIVACGREWTPLLLAATLATGCSSAPRPRHSVVLITFDTTRADRLGAYGGPDRVSPAVDGLARRGVLFEKAQAQAAVTPVAHASLFTAQNPYQHGLRTLHGNQSFRLPEAALTLAERFEELGYRTAAFVSAFPCSRRFGLDQGFDVFDEDFAIGRARIGKAGNVSSGLAQRDSRRTTDAALAWLRGRAPGELYFLWVHYFDPHDPLLRPPPAFTQPFMEGMAEHESMERLLSQDLPGFVEQYAGRPEIMRPWLRRLYDAEIAFADSQLARLLEAVEARTPANVPLIAVTSDHGEGLGDHGWWAHGILYQEQLHVPLVLAGSGLPRGLRVPDRVRHVDVAPTLLDLAAGSGFEYPVEGISLDPLIRARAAGREPDPHDRPGPAYADSVALMRYGAVFSKDVVEVKDDQLYSWIEGDLKWIRHRLKPQEGELYDLAHDPRESVNLRDSRPRDAGRLDANLEARRPMTAQIDFSLPEDEEVRSRLRSLGYAD